MKKFLAILLALVMVLGVCACGEKEQPQEPQTEAIIKVIALGTSGFSMSVDESYAEGEISAEDTDESQVAYFFSENSLVDFDVYQWALADGETLQGTAEAEAAEFGATAESKTYGGITVYCYNAEEDYDGTTYQTVTCLMENGGYVLELVFWLDGEGAQEAVEAMLSSLTVEAIELAEQTTENGKVINLGTSNLSITVDADYAEGEISAEDTDESQVAYYFSEECLVDFDVYQWALADGETLEASAEAEAAEFDAEAQDAEFNGIAVKFYNATEESDGQSYPTVTYLMEDEGNIVELVFWLDGEGAQEIVDGFMATLSK